MNMSVSDPTTVFALVCVIRNRPISVPAGCIRLDAGDLTAVLAEHSSALLVGESGEQALTDPKHVTQLAIDHAKQVDRVSRQTQVMPVAFGSIFNSLASVRRLMLRNTGVIVTFLDQIEGTHEWGIKASVDARGAKQAYADRVVRDAGLDPAMPPGTRYFKEQVLRRSATASFSSAMSERCAALEPLWREVASRVTSRSVLLRHDERLTIASWAALVPEATRGRLEECIALVNTQLEAEQIRIELNGPWPAWSFLPRIEQD